MTSIQNRRPAVIATAQEVLPQFGLAYLVDDDHTAWTVTKSMDGPGIDRLQPGQRVQLTLLHSGRISLVSAYQPLR